MTPGSAENLELSRALIAAIRRAEAYRRNGRKLAAAHRRALRYHAASLAVATISGALAAVLALGWPL